MVTEKEIIDIFLGIPYLHRGRDFDINCNGLDCWGLIKAVYKKLNYEVWDIEEEYDYEWSWKGRDLFIENYHKEWEKVERPRLFDVVLFKNWKDIANHGGIVLKGNKFLHTCKAGVVVSRLSEPVWQRRFEGFYHLKKRQ